MFGISLWLSCICIRGGTVLYLCHLCFFCDSMSGPVFPGFVFLLLIWKPSLIKNRLAAPTVCQILYAQRRGGWCISLHGDGLQLEWFATAYEDMESQWEKMYFFPNMVTVRQKWVPFPWSFLTPLWTHRQQWHSQILEIKSWKWWFPPYVPLSLCVCLLYCICYGLDLKCSQRPCAIDLATTHQC